MSREDVRLNRKSWDAGSAEYQSNNAAQLNRWDRLGWGTWDILEDDVRALGDVRGLSALELGTGAAQFGIKVAMRGARVIGLDLSWAQLSGAPSNFESSRTRFPLVQGSAEELPFRPGAFDLVFCDHGATSFTDPHITIPEASRVLRKGGRLVFNIATPWIWTCWGEKMTPSPEGCCGAITSQPWAGMWSRTKTGPRSNGCSHTGTGSVCSARAGWGSRT
jgi:ubiquinone/menaquinone biosynthesis C-methylase UbiE